MGDVPIRVPETETIDEVERIARKVIAGHEQGSIRRITLWITLVIGLVLTAFMGTLGLIIALPALVLLLSTDQLL